MGLYLSQKIAKKLGHYITLESEYGKGTEVIIHFLKWNNYYDVTKM
jgi:signal transduction histidine kinase